MRRIVLTALALGFVLPLTARAQEGALRGVWKITEVSLTSPDTSWTQTDPRPALLMFAEHHYSSMGTRGSSPRERLSDEPSDAERLEAWGPFWANAGTYEVTGSTVTLRAIVAKNPNNEGSWTRTFTYRVEGDTLLTSFETATGAEISVTYLRLE
jgi:hypothetical protein